MATPIAVEFQAEIYYLLGTASAPSTTANDASNYLHTYNNRFHCLQIVNPSAATVTVSVSIDNVHWVQLYQGTDATYFAVYQGFYPWIKAVRDSSTTPVTVIWGGKELFV